MSDTATTSRSAVTARRLSSVARDAASSPLAPPIAMMGLAGILSLICLACESLWVDEASSYWISRLGGRDLYNIGFSFDAAMPLYYATLHLWLELGHSEVAIRSLSVVFTVASVGALYGLAKELFGRRIAFVSALLFAVAPTTTQYAQEARGYAMLTLLSICTVWTFVRAIEGGSVARWVVFGVTCAAMILTQPTGAFLLPDLAVPLFVGRSPGRSGWIALGAAAVVCAPLLLKALDRLGSFSLPAPSRLVGLVLDAATGGRTFATVVVVAALILGGIAFYRRPDLRDRRSSGLVLAGAWAAVPLLIYWLLSSSLPLSAGRYTIVSTPGVVLLIGAAIGPLRPRATRAALAGAIVVLSLVAVIGALADRTKEDWRDVAAYISEHGSATDGIVFFAPGVAPAFDYYERALGAMPQQVYPPEGWHSTDWRVPGHPSVEATVIADGTSFEGRDRVWLVASHEEPIEEGDVRGPENETLHRLLDADYRVVDLPEDATFTGITVVLFERRARA